MDETIAVTITSSQSGLGSNDNERALHTLQKPHTGASNRM